MFCVRSSDAIVFVKQYFTTTLDLRTEQLTIIWRLAFETSTTKIYIRGSDTVPLITTPSSLRKSIVWSKSIAGFDFNLEQSKRKL